MSTVRSRLSSLTKSARDVFDHLGCRDGILSCSVISVVRDSGTRSGRSRPSYQKPPEVRSYATPASSPVRRRPTSAAAGIVADCHATLPSPRHDRTVAYPADDADAAVDQMTDAAAHGSARRHDDVVTPNISPESPEGAGDSLAACRLESWRTHVDTTVTDRELSPGQCRCRQAQALSKLCRGPQMPTLSARGAKQHGLDFCRWEPDENTTPTCASQLESPSPFECADLQSSLAPASCPRHESRQNLDHMSLAPFRASLRGCSHQGV